MLLGNASNRIDTFTGENIGSAILDGRVAGDHDVTALDLKRFDATFNQAYEA